MRDYYDFEVAKEGEAITVLVGSKKSTDTDPTHPASIVFKQGLGARKDLDASLKLQGKAPGFLPVIVAGEDFFIREAYPNKLATKWSDVKGQSKSLLSQAMNLSFAMLDAGVIDRDRSVVKGMGDNIVARNVVISDKLYFFDFEPEHIIDWSKELTVADVGAIELWKTTHENLIKAMAINLGLSGQVETLLIGFRETAGKVMANKSEQAAKIWHGLVNPKVDVVSEYQPPEFLATPVVASKRASLPPVSITPSPSLTEPTVEAIFALMKDFYAAANSRSAFFQPSTEAIIDKMARVTHRVNNRHGTAYDTLEMMINKDSDPMFRRVAANLLEGTKVYLDKAYSKQLHDKDELWERPKGPWGS